jgi:hypothetical protein
MDATRESRAWQDASERCSSLWPWDDASVSSKCSRGDLRVPDRCREELRLDMAVGHG